MYVPALIMAIQKKKAENKIQITISLPFFNVAKFKQNTVLFVLFCDEFCLYCVTCSVGSYWLYQGCNG